MGSDLFDARPDLLGERADEVLGFSLRSVCLDGPEVELTRTQHAQPAIFALAYALWQELSDEAGPLPAGAAGHSLGEYTALTAAGALDYDTALRLVAVRSRAMASAAALEPSGMAALIGADAGLAERVSGERRAAGGRLQVANVNAPGQMVVAGGLDDLEWLSAHARDLGIRRVIPLNVAGAFHSAFMSAATAELQAALAGAILGETRFPVWSNTTARPHQEATTIELLGRQMVEPVLFADSLADMAGEGIDTFVHVGPGDVTAGLARKTVTGANVHVVSGIEDIPSVTSVVGTIGRP